MLKPAYITFTAIAALLALLPVTSLAASADARLCNMQGREIALRVSEEVSRSLDADQRNRIAAIAEEVCLDFGETPAAPAAQSNLPVISRPAAAQQAAPAATPVAVAPAEETQAMEQAMQEEDEESGLFGNIRIIPPEERVQRPGLKRK